MKAGGRLVHDVDDPEQVGDDLGSEPQALKLARRHGRGAPLQGQVAQAEVEQHREPTAEICGDALDHQGFLRMALS